MIGERGGLLAKWRVRMCMWIGMDEVRLCRRSVSGKRKVGILGWDWLRGIGQGGGGK